MEERAYQINAIAELRAQFAALRAQPAAAKGPVSVMLYSPTGSGKTEMALIVGKGALAKDKRVLMIADRKTLVHQTVKRALKSGIESGIIQAENTARTWMSFQTASLQTLVRRAELLENAMERADVVIVDEAHKATNASYGKVWDSVRPGTIILGLSATPFAKGLSERFQGIVIAETISGLIKAGYLVPPECWAAEEKPDLKGIRKIAGDYDEDELAQRMMRGTLIEGIVKHWRKLANGLKTVVFATSILHSQEIVGEFKRAGIEAEHLDAYTPDDARAEILGRLERGETRVVSNVSVLAEGWDMPSVECMILARPTRSLIRYIQMAGRVLRPFPGKTRGLILDHSDTVRRLGMPDEDLPISLDPRALKEREARKEDDPALPKECPNCGFMKPPKTRKCPRCGCEPKGKAEVEYEDGELVRVLPKSQRKKLTDDERRTVFGMFEWFATERGYGNPRGWAWHKFKAWAGDGVPVPREGTMTVPSIEIANWIRSEHIRYAKSKEKKNGAALLGNGVRGSDGV